ncbi:MAG: NAD-dependent epimerase/dehydratase family protein [Gammaproteobacteria bacterium]
MPTRYLVTGGCGFIGTALIRRILQVEPGAVICVLDNLLVGTAEDLGRVSAFTRRPGDECRTATGVVLVEGDVRNYETALLCAEGVDCIVHLAASTSVAISVEDPRTDMENNVIGTFNMLEAARHNAVAKFVFASSGAPIGEAQPPFHEEIPARPVSPYGASKLAGEGYCCAYSKSFGLSTVSLRFGNVYGPGSRHKSSVVAKLTRQALLGQTCEIYGDGTQSRDFIYIDDLVNAVLCAIDRDVAGELFHIATGREHTVAEVVAIISELLGEHGITMSIAHGARRTGDVTRNFADTRKAESILGWTPIMDLRGGIRRTVDYFIQEGCEPA